MFISPMLLNPIEEIPVVNDTFTNKKYTPIAELKLDGFRTILSNMDRTKIYTRHNTDITNTFPELIENELPKGVILDGETIQTDPVTGQPCFEDVISRFHMRNVSKIKHLADHNPVTFCAFDILYYRGKSVMALSLLERKELLQEVLRKDTRSIIKVRHMDGSDAADLFKECRERKLEGIVIKQNKPYLPGTRPKGYWDKMICYNEAEVRIIGVRKGKFGWLASYPDGRFAGVIELAVPLQAKRIVYDFAQKYGRNAGQNIYLPESLPCKVRYRALTQKGLMRLAEFQEFVFIPRV